MPGYLLDTNHLSAWEREDRKFMARVRAEPMENLIWVCPISLGEVEFGLRTEGAADPERHAACRRFINKTLQFVHDIKATTMYSYAQVVQQICQKNRRTRGSMRAHLFQLGVDVNDVWIAAVAIEHNLILLTSDKMKTIRDCVPELRVQNWLE